MTVISLTGGIGSGKSTLASVAREAGWNVLDTDLLCFAAYRDQHFIDKLRNLFNVPATLRSNREVTSYIRSIPEYRRIVGPVLGEEVRMRVTLQLHRSALTYSSNILIDSALLFEWRLDRLCSHTIALTAPAHIRLARATSRKENAVSAADFSNIAQLQGSDDVRNSRTDFIIDTSKGRDVTAQEFVAILRKL